MNTLKKLRYAFIAAIMILGSSILTSCDKDEMTALELHGQWYGDFGMNYSYEEPVYDRYGHITGYVTRRFECYDTKIRFHQKGFTDHGTGTQVDYYKYGPYEYIYYDFDWWVQNGIIKLRYRWANEWDTDIINYSLSSTHFRGTFDFTRVHFDLLSLDKSAYNWDIRNSYYRNYGYGCDPYMNYGYYPYNYYAPGKPGVQKNSVERNDSAFIPSMQEIHIGNRYAEKIEE